MVFELELCNKRFSLSNPIIHTPIPFWVDIIHDNEEYKYLGTEEILKLLNDQDKEIKILNQRIKILREEIQSTVYILKMQTRKLEGY